MRWRVVPRQAEAGSQALFAELLRDAGLSERDFAQTAPARSETDAALAVLEFTEPGNVTGKGCAELKELVRPKDL